MNEYTVNYNGIEFKIKVGKPVINSALFGATVSGVLDGEELTQIIPLTSDVVDETLLRSLCEACLIYNGRMDRVMPKK